MGEISDRRLFPPHKNQTVKLLNFCSVEVHPFLLSIKYVCNRLNRIFTFTIMTTKDIYNVPKFEILMKL